MAGSGTYQVNAGRFQDPMNSFNNSTRMLQDSISDLGRRKTARQDEALKALQQQKVLQQKQATTNILKNTPDRRFNQELADQQTGAVAQQALADYNSMFNADTGERLTSEDPKEASALKANQDAYENKKIETWIGDTDENFGVLKDTASQYGDNVYKQMISAGIDPTVAAAERERQIKMKKAPETSKATLAAMKAKNDAQQKGFDLEQKAIETNAKNYVSETVRDGTGKAATGSGKKKNARYGADKWDQTKYSENLASALNIEDWTLLPGDSNTAAAAMRDVMRTKGISANDAVGLLDEIYGDAANFGDKTYLATESGMSETLANLADQRGLKKASYNSAGKGIDGTGNSTTTSGSTFSKAGLKAMSELSQRRTAATERIYGNIGKGENRVLLKDKDIKDYLGIDSSVNIKTKAPKATADNTTGSKSNRILFDGKTGGIGQAMNKKGDGLLAEYITNNPEEFAPEYDALDKDQKDSVNKVIEATPQSTWTNLVKDDLAKSKVLDDNAASKNTVLETSPDEEEKAPVVGSTDVNFRDYVANNDNLSVADKGMMLNENTFGNLNMDDALQFNKNLGGDMAAGIGNMVRTPWNALFKSKKERDASTPYTREDFAGSQDSNPVDNRPSISGNTQPILGNNESVMNPSARTNPLPGVSQMQNQIPGGNVLGNKPVQSISPENEKEIKSIMNTWSPSQQREFSQAMSDPTISVIDKLSIFRDLGFSTNQAQEALSASQ